MKIAVLFPGQGAQYVGMGKELYHNSNDCKEIYDRAADMLSWDVKEVCFEDKEGKINQTRYTQAALFVTNVAIYEAIKKKIKVDAMLGFSLGEYSAINASGALSFEKTLVLVEKRSIFMEECAKNNPGGMAAVLGLEVDKIYDVCNRISDQISNEVSDQISNDISSNEKSNENHFNDSIVTNKDTTKTIRDYIAVANDNCEGQVTISGTTQGLEKATVLLKEAGAKRVLPIKVSGAFHSELMEDAANQMTREAEKITFSDPTCPIISNVTAKPMLTAGEIKDNIPLQIVKGVRFRESILYLAEQGFDTFIEVGPKTTLCNLIKKILPDAKTLQVEDLQGIDNIVAELG